MSLTTFTFNRAQIMRARAYTYNVLIPPANPAVTLARAKQHLKIPTSETAFDAEITALISAATACAEEFMRRTMVNTTFVTFRDFFAHCIELRRSRASVVNSIEYLKEGVLTPVSSSIFFLTDHNDFSEIHLQENAIWPTDFDSVVQTIKIEFVAGYGIDDTSVPEDIKMAILNHVAFMFQNRGDCSGSSGSAECASALPGLSQLIYKKHKILQTTTSICT